jgi:hypothetical protein
VSFLAPFWLGVAAAAAAGIVALHLITTQRPPPAALPTARFVPQGDARASSRAARPTDLLLLLLRCLALLLLGTAFAGPVTHSRGASLARVIVVDRSRGSLRDVRDSAIAIARAGDAIVLFDSSAMIVTHNTQDSLRTLEPSHARGSLSAALVGARRAARELAAGADSIEMVIVSPLTTDEIDAASADAVDTWPGRVRLARTGAARRVPVFISLMSDEPDDALRPAIGALNAAAGRGAATAEVRVMRSPPLAADSAAARAGAAVVFWPHIGKAAPAAEGLWAGNATLVAPLGRIVSAQPLAGSRIVARWADGKPAAIEWPLGQGCVRTIGVGVPVAGDITLQPAFVSVAQSLLGPCDGAIVGTALSDSLARSFARSGPAATAAALRSSDENSPLTPWLLAAALLLLTGELFVRRGATAVAS